MHLRNSWTRSMSACAMRQVPSGASGGRGENPCGLVSGQAHCTDHSSAYYLRVYRKAGFSPPTANAPLGVPVGMDILGRPWSEGRLIELAFGFEQALHARKSPASAPALAAR